jgi:hypothetical protein
VELCVSQIGKVFKRKTGVAVMLGGALCEAWHQIISQLQPFVEPHILSG